MNWRDYLRLMRPHQWVKNGFVLTGLVFGHAWQVPELVHNVLLAVLAFCLASSAVYVHNDLNDAEQDRLHPSKCKRPIASGVIARHHGWLFLLVLLVSAMAIAWVASPGVASYVLAYLLLQWAYTRYLKQVVLVDVFTISLGFMLRIMAGTDGVGIPPSSWLLFCGMWATLFLAFVKRHAESSACANEASGHRPVLQHYTPELLDKLITMTGMGMILSYSFYTLDVDVRRLHGSDALIATAPFVIFACFRYLLLMHQQRAGGDPSRELLRDRHIVLAGLGWLLTTLWVLM